MDDVRAAMAGGVVKRVPQNSTESCRHRITIFVKENNKIETIVAMPFFQSIVT